MKRVFYLEGSLAFWLLVFCFSISAQTVDINGTWTGKTVCPFGQAEIVIEIQGTTGTFNFDGYGPQKLHAAKFPLTMVFMKENGEVVVFFAGPSPYENFQNFKAKLSADGKILNDALGLRISSGFCNKFSLNKSVAGRVPQRSARKTNINPRPASSSALKPASNSAPTRSQNQPVVKSAPTASVKTGSLTGSSFSANGLTNEALLTNLYRGNFDDISIRRDNLGFATLYESYLGAYWRKCGSDLPDNRVMMTRKRCVRWTVLTNIYGAEVGTRNCIEEEDEPTGQYADPQMYAAYKEVSRIVQADSLKHVIPALTNPLGTVGGMLNSAVTAQSDMEGLLGLNACKSPGLMRFQENMRLFALNKLPIALDGQTSNPSPVVISKNQDYTRLIDDLLIDQSKTWAVNRYIRGSASRLTVLSQDAEGRPTKLTATYMFNDGLFGGQGPGTVTLTFSDGMPDCMYFWDAQGICRTLDRKIVSAFAKGAYQK